MLPAADVNNFADEKPVIVNKSVLSQNSRRTRMARKTNIVPKRFYVLTKTFAPGRALSPRNSQSPSPARASRAETNFSIRFSFRQGCVFTHPNQNLS